MTLAPGPTWTTDFVVRRTILFLAFEEIRRIRHEEDWQPMRRTPTAWGGRSVEFGRAESARRLRDARDVLRSMGARVPPSARRVMRDMRARRESA